MRARGVVSDLALGLDGLRVDQVNQRLSFPPSTWESAQRLSVMMTDSVAALCCRECSSCFTLHSYAFACPPSQRRDEPRACVS